jgi:starch synthase (maltosyl-transferring)
LSAPTTTIIRETVQTLRRVAIEKVTPEVDGGRFPAKRTIGDMVQVRADIFADGHDVLGATLRYRRCEQGRCDEGPTDDAAWREAEMKFVDNDRWGGEFKVEALGRWVYTIVAWVDEWRSWGAGLRKKADAGQEISVDALMGVGLLQAAAARGRGADAKNLTEAAARLEDLAAKDRDATVKLVGDPELAALMNRNRDRAADTRYERDLTVVVDPVKARFSTWYEMFPRSCTTDPSRHGTFRDCIDRLGYIAGMGFDVLYLPPIHPIGKTERKGKNNSTTPASGDWGSPWRTSRPCSGQHAKWELM